MIGRKIKIAVWKVVFASAVASLALSASALLTSNASAAEADDFNKARKNFIADRAKSFARAANKIPASSEYRPLLDFWGAAIELRRNRPQALENLHRQTESFYVRDRAKRTLAEHYISRNNWDKFAEVADASDCSSLIWDMHRQQAQKDAAKQLWAADTRFNDTLCIAAYKRAFKSGLLTDDDKRLKFRALAGSGLLSRTRRFMRHFPVGVSYGKTRKTVLRAARYIRGKHSLSTPAQRDLVMIAAMAAARKHRSLSISRWEAFSQYFSEEENSQVWAKIAERAARAHDKDAMELFRRARQYESYDENARAWRVRAALVADDYADVIRTIQHMPETESSLSAWRYWQAVALAQTGGVAEAQTRLRALANDEDDYYGLLAKETMDIPLALPTARAPQARAEGDFALALAVRRAGQAKLGRQIWDRALRQAEPEQILAAAREAEAEKWYLASINAANAADDPAAHELRYPTPYQETIDKYSAQFGLERAFVYALIRRESRFMPKAISSAKARGLMQVLPSTAKRVARRHGYNRYRLSRLTRVDTNVIIGATYLRDLAKKFNAHPAQVAAAYNAGPGRVVRWRKKIADTLALVENIPLRETRLYVKALLAARVHYALRFGEPPPSIQNLIDRTIISQEKIASVDEVSSD